MIVISAITFLIGVGVRVAVTNTLEVLISVSAKTFAAKS
jgi:hypothetical protein